MVGTLGSIWDYLLSELWEPLEAYSGYNCSAPSDFYSGLYSAVESHISPRPTV